MEKEDGKQHGICSSNKGYMYGWDGNGILCRIEKAMFHVPGSTSPQGGLERTSSDG